MAGSTYRVSNLSEVCYSPNGILNKSRLSTGSYSISGALEVMARDSINSYGNVSNKSTMSLLEQSSDNEISEKYWELKSLRNEFQERELETQYIKYIRKIRGGFFVTFLIMHFLLCLVHIVMLLSFTEGTLREQLYEIILYSFTGILPLGMFLIKCDLTRKYEWLYPLMSCITITLIVTSDILVAALNENSTFQMEYPGLRPAFIEHIYLACYLFLPFDQNFQVAVMGVTTAIAYLICLKFITYRLVTDLYTQLGCDLLYLTCLNILGIYQRFLSEIITRRMFLDGRQCVQTTMKLTFQKNKEERLMLSILPPQVCKRVQTDIETIYNIMNSGNNNISTSVKPFEDLYIEQHYDVTILYADIVHYTKMTTTLPVKKLIIVLNELFGAFDDASEFHKLLRIKFLGDCYYCVAGIPQVADNTAHLNHAKKCVEFGYDMISIIQYVREKHDIDIDMRIGVHSGRILSGLVGASKWQYDIWSKDVLIANVMEQTGKPGKVHITNNTLLKLDNIAEYDYERTYAEAIDQFLADSGIITYLILPKNNDHSIEEPSTSHQLYDKRVSVRPRSSNLSKYGNRPKVSLQRLRKQSLVEKTLPTSNRRQFFMDDTYKEYQEMSTLVDSKMDEEIDRLPMGKFEFLSKDNYFNHLFLLFNNWKWEKLYFNQPDPMFKFYIILCVITYISIFSIQLLSLQGKNTIVWIFSISLLLILFLLIPLTWARYIQPDPNNHEEHEKLTLQIVQYFKTWSTTIIYNVIWRCIIYVLVCILVMICALLPLLDCKWSPTESNIIFELLSVENSYKNCIKPWHITQTISLVLFASFMFIRIHFLLKLIISSMITLIYAWIIWEKRFKFYGDSESWNVNFLPQLSQILTIVFLAVTGHIIDRQQEFMNRLDYQWKIRLNKERDEAATTDRINTMLLQNILPLHVAKIYMNPRREPNSLYYEEYASVSVIFASLIGYKLGVDDETEDSELTMLRVLNTIICDFDRLLIEHEGTKVEKIKMAGWTFMAACGLVPEQQESVMSENKEVENDVVITITRLAIKFLKAIQCINKESQQRFQLRIGISHGRVSAGVVGSKKPLYDIWGDTVNMASRMDSTGVPNKIQVTTETAKVLETQNIHCDLRGNIFVKGKNMVKTYFIKLDKNFDFIECDNL